MIKGIYYSLGENRMGTAVVRWYDIAERPMPDGSRRPSHPIFRSEEKATVEMIEEITKNPKYKLLP